MAATCLATLTHGRMRACTSPPSAQLQTSRTLSAHIEHSWNNALRKKVIPQRAMLRHSRAIVAKMDMQVMVKLSVARSSGKLDLSNCNLTEVPEELCGIVDLEVVHSC